MSETKNFDMTPFGVIIKSATKRCYNFIIQEAKGMDKHGQETFLNFILQRVQEGKEDEARKVLTENFKKQDEGTFSQEDIQEFIPKMMSLLKPEKLEEVQAVVKRFSGDFGNK